MTITAPPLLPSPVPAAAARGVETLADLIDRLGGVSPARIRLRPPPGTATEQDLIAAETGDSPLCELVEGTLVEKPVGARESLLAGAILAALRAFVRPRNLGVVLGADGMLRYYRSSIRLPDVCFISWARLPGRQVPEGAVWDVFPDIAVEVLSAGNTAGEMARKRLEYFEAGAPLVWMVDPEGRAVSVYTSVEQFTVLNESQSLDGGTVLPGFSLGLRDLFAELDARGE